MALNTILRISTVGIFVIFIIFLGINIDGHFYQQEIKTSVSSGDILYKIFGELRAVIGATFFIKADEYYHGGMQHLFATDGSCLGDEHRHNHWEEEIERLNHQPEKLRCKEGTDFIARINQAIYDQPVLHLSDKQSIEILPWFYLATRIDPHNIQAYTTGGFWLATRLGKIEEALKFLQEGLRYNPFSWQIYSQSGDIYFLNLKDYYKAASYLKHAYEMMDETSSTIFERKHVLTFLAASYERIGDHQQAVYYYEQLYKLFGEDQKIKDKIDSLSGALKLP